MLISYKRGQGSIVLRIKILDSSATTGAGLAGLTFASAGLIVATIADNEATVTAYTQAGSTIETVATLGTYAAPTATKCRFKEVDATNHPGVYEIHIADARFAVASAKSLLVSVSGATNVAETDAVIPLQDMDPYDAVRGGMTALPNAAADGPLGLPISDAGGLDLDTLLAFLDAAISSRNAVTPPTVAELNARTILAANYATAANLATVAEYLDTEIAAILLDTGTTIPNTLAGLSTHSAADVLAAVQAAGTHLTLIKAVTDALNNYDGTDTSGVTTLLDRLSEVRIAELDAANLPADLDATKAVTDALPNAGALTDIAADAARLTAARAAVLTDWIQDGRLDVILDAASAPSAGAVADAVLDELLSEHVIVGSAGAGIAAAGSAGDPWSTALPGAYGAGTAGLIIGSTLIRAATVFDGMTLTEILTTLLGIFGGKCDYTTSTRTVVFYARDGTTPVATLVLGTDPGNRTSSTLFGE